MGVEELEGQKKLKQNIEQIREDIKKIRENELAHIDVRLSNLESKARAPLTSLYLVAAFAVFVGIVAVVTFSGALAVSVAVICGAILVLSILAIGKTIGIKRD